MEINNNLSLIFLESNEVENKEIIKEANKNNEEKTITLFGNRRK